jgi:hypothetical protein
MTSKKRPSIISESRIPDSLFPCTFAMVFLDPVGKGQWHHGKVRGGADKEEKMQVDEKM